MSDKDYYRILGVNRTASAKDIKDAYRNLAREHHPDRNSGSKDAEAKFKIINEAYSVLGDEQKRAAYDRFGTSGPSAGGGANSGFNAHDFGDIFGDFFSDIMGGGRGRSGGTANTRGSDLTTRIEITLEDAFSGTTKELSFTAQLSCANCAGKGTKTPENVSTCSTCNGHGVVRVRQGIFAVEQTCSACKGSGQIIKSPCVICHGIGRHAAQKRLNVSIPPGAQSGLKIRHPGEGEGGVRGAASGDLYVEVIVKSHDVFLVKGHDLHFTLLLSFPKAALGGVAEVKTIDGGKVELTVPAGTNTGDKLRLKDRGMSILRSHSRGDMYAHAFVQTPQNLTEKQKEILKAFSGELRDNEPRDKEKESSGFFSKMKNLWP